MTEGAPPDNSPWARLASALDSQLRSQHGPRFAGLRIAADGQIEVLAVGEDQALAALVDQVRSSTAPDLSVAIRADSRYSLAMLEALRDDVLEHRASLEAQGIAINSLGVDIATNRVLIGVPQPTNEVTQILGRLFGADRIAVVRSRAFGADAKVTAP